MSWRSYQRRTITRRSLLKGLGTSAGSLFLTPMLSRIRAEAQGAPPKQRVIFVVSGNGFSLAGDWKRFTNPTPLIESIGSDFGGEIPHAPTWSRWRDRFVYLNGMANKMGSGSFAGHRSHWYSLICRPYQGSGSPGGISIDEHLAREVGMGSVFPALRIGSEGPGNGLIPVNSAAGAGSPIPTQNDPVEAYRSLFGVGSTDPSLRAGFEEQGLVLDGIRAEAQIAERKLNGEDRWKLQHFLYSVETFQAKHRQLQQLEDHVRGCAPATPKWPRRRTWVRCSRSRPTWRGPP